MSKDLRCRFIRNTMTSMIAILRAKGDGDRYPSKPEVTAMAKRIVLYYPMLQDRDLSSKNAWGARRVFIDSDSCREEDKHKKILEAYPCFKDIGHVMGELQCILDKDNIHYIDELKERWDNF
ncbi:hypothetical protein MHYP_G00172620 [Metynnis hypsauchen]